MTPNELKAYVDAAMKHHDTLAVLVLILVPVISIVGSVITAYLKEEGENSATKEDVGVITKQIESSKKITWGGQMVWVASPLRTSKGFHLSKNSKN